MLVDHDGYLPAYACICEGRRQDVPVIRGLPLPPASILAMDRGYDHYKLFVPWSDAGVFFVIRLKAGAAFFGAVAPGPVAPR